MTTYDVTQETFTEILSKTRDMFVLNEPVVLPNGEHHYVLNYNLAWKDAPAIRIQFTDGSEMCIRCPGGRWHE